MNYTKILIAFLIVLGANQIIFGQTNQRNVPEASRRLTLDQIKDRDFERRRANMNILSGRARSGHERSIIRKKPLTKEEKEKIKKITSPSEEDLAKYKNFLKQPETGIFRLLPDYDCESKHLVRLDGNCANFVSNAWAYSFRWKYYSDITWHDLSFKNNALVSDGFFSQGLMVSLGDVPIENLSPTGGGVKYLFDFKPETEFAAVRKQHEQIKKGFDDGDYFYSNKLEVTENTTYAVRVIAYKYKDKAQRGFLRRGEKSFTYLEFDKRKDMIVAFRIIRKNDDKSDDGGLTIVWKELQEIKPPTIVFQKDEQPINFKTVGK